MSAWTFWIALMALAVFPHTASATSCALTSKLVNPCHPLLGALATGYPQVADDLRSQNLYHESRIGRQLDIVKGKFHVGPQYLTADEKYFATRPNTILTFDWKASTNWAQASGSNASVNAIIDNMADSVKSLGTTKVLLVLHHEPQNDVSSGTTCNMSGKGTSGSPADYRAMWRNVRTRFANRGANNVVWALAYQGYQAYNCLIPQLWPGNDMVDWVLVDSYATGNNPSIGASYGKAYSFMSSTSDATHNYLSKPWGLGEFGVHNATQAQQYAYWDSFKTAVDKATYPQVKAFINFDSPGYEPFPGIRVAYADNGTYDPVEQQHYNAFARDPKLTNAGGGGDCTYPLMTTNIISTSNYYTGCGVVTPTKTFVPANYDSAYAFVYGRQDCPAYAYCIAAGEPTVLAWRWTGTAWVRSSFNRDERVWVRAFGSGWSWAWTLRTGYLAVQTSRLYT